MKRGDTVYLCADNGDKVAVGEGELTYLDKKSFSVSYRRDVVGQSWLLGGPVSLLHTGVAIKMTEIEALMWADERMVANLKAAREYWNADIREVRAKLRVKRGEVRQALLAKLKPGDYVRRIRWSELTDGAQTLATEIVALHPGARVYVRLAKDLASDFDELTWRTNALSDGEYGYKSVPMGFGTRVFGIPKSKD